MSQSFAARQAAARRAQSPSRRGTFVRTSVGLSSLLVLMFTALQATSVIAWPLWVILMPWIAVGTIFALIVLLGIIIATGQAIRAS